MGRLEEAREIVERLRAFTAVQAPVSVRSFPCRSRPDLAAFS
jgi:hypothetical protein